MPLFRSLKEKRAWFYAFLVLIAILLTLVLGRPLQDALRDQNVQAIFFVIGMLLTGATIIAHGIKVRPGKSELAIWLGLAAVYLMFFFRLGAPERSHLIEYSVLAIFIHKAFIERFGPKGSILKSALWALILTVSIGALDEIIQLFIPNRVFDPIDILFNSLATFFAIASSLLLIWVRKKFRNA